MCLQYIPGGLWLSELEDKLSEYASQYAAEISVTVNMHTWGWYWFSYWNVICSLTLGSEQHSVAEAIAVCSKNSQCSWDQTGIFYTKDYHSQIYCSTAGKYLTDRLRRGKKVQSRGQINPYLRKVLVQCMLFVQVKAHLQSVLIKRLISLSFVPTLVDSFSAQRH